MAVNMKVGEVWKSADGIYTLRVTGFYKFLGSTDPKMGYGVLAVTTGKIVSGPAQWAVTLEDWALLGFKKQPARKAKK
jgi:hypothetical protein